MPSYTTEQKAAAFDILWKACGPSKGTLYDWVHRSVGFDAAHESKLLRVPRYKFEILFEGDAYDFHDVLHYLITQGDSIVKTNS